MLETIKAEVPETGTQLLIDADRPFEIGTGDGTLRISGQGGDGSIIGDSTWVETSPNEASLMAMWLRSVETPSPELLEHITQEIAATFHSRLSGRDAHQIAELCTQAIKFFLKDRHNVGAVSDMTLTNLAERFERASSRVHQLGESTGGSKSGRKY